MCFLQIIVYILKHRKENFFTDLRVIRYTITSRVSEDAQEFLKNQSQYIVFRNTVFAEFSPHQCVGNICQRSVNM